MNTISIVAEEPRHAAWLNNLLDRTMGEIRFRRASQRIREGRLPAKGLARIAMDEEGHLLGTVRLWETAVAGASRVLMLGPLAVEPEMNGKGVGARLMQDAISRATKLGYSAIVLVGDPAYYERFGFKAATAKRIAMPGPFERHRLLALELKPNALSYARGPLRAAGEREQSSEFKKSRAV